MSPDRAARLVIMSSFLYYRHDAPVISDAEYDELVSLVVKEWDQIAPLRQWQMESAEAMAATGFHIKITPRDEAGAFHWYRDCTGRELDADLIEDDEWHTDGPDGARWVSVAGS